ncbi:hydrogenase nickel incorporation protein HypB [Acidiphilium sp.]|uniref:hydrogenase nickel incorporation protein HypB n=1 Tax=Acidiphilium sp. TaxID=527 RepID=UPI00258D2EC8|nr:hydrogenase nickel incorporation protein HypB [Acidiphilium sp.]
MMCGICGCGDTGEHHYDHEHEHEHEHGHGHGHDHGHDHGHAPEHVHAHAAGLAPARMVRVEQDIMAANQRHADANRTYFAERGIFVVNLVSSPGSGKTSLLVRTVAALKAEMPVAVIEGDQQTEFDAERIRAAGAPAWQINTGKACHLDAHMVGHALEHLPALEGGILFIENVGNLVCPAGFDLGEAHKVVILSVTEGEDKPLKYPHMFHAADLMLVNKIDLLPHVACDMELILAGALRVNPAIGSVAVSAATGEGFGAWLDWLRQGRERARRAQHGAMQARREALRRELASIDATLAG